MSVEELARETRSSIELTRNAKGDYQWVIKCYYEDGQHVQALARTWAIDSALRKDYLPKEEVWRLTEKGKRQADAIKAKRND